LSLCDIFTLCTYTNVGQYMKMTVLILCAYDSYDFVEYLLANQLWINNWVDKVNEIYYVPGNLVHIYHSIFTFMLPSIYFCRLNLLIILNQNLHNRDVNDFGKIILSYSVFSIAWNQHAIRSSLLLDMTHYSLSLYLLIRCSARSKWTYIFKKIEMVMSTC